MRLRYTPNGAAELSEIMAYIAKQNPQGASRVRARIRAVTNLLLEQPHAGLRTNVAPLRRMVATPYPYLIFYEATEGDIIVHGVRHAARRPIA